MANPEHVAIVNAGKEALAAWREEHPDELLDLSGRKFENKDFSQFGFGKANFDFAILKEIVFDEVYFETCSFSNAQLNEVVFKNGKLKEANFEDATLIQTMIENRRSRH